MVAYEIVRRLQNQLRRERGLTPKREAPVRVALAHPNTYHVGMSNLGLQVVYRMFNEHPAFLCERFFLPTPSLQDLHRKSTTPLLTLESQQPVNTFNLIAFSVSFEFDYVWLKRMLKLARLPAYRHERQNHHPIVLVGGPCAWMNPLPLTPYVDVFALGDGEPLVEYIIEAFLEHRDRTARLKALAEHPAFYVPDIHGDHPLVLRETGRKPAFVRAGETVTPPHSCILTPDTEFGQTFLIEIMRGCPHWCRFCWIGYNHLPLKFAPIDAIFDLIDRRAPSDATIGLIGASPADHPRFRDLIEGILERGYEVTVSSLRIDTLDADLLYALRRAGKRNLTMAPETGSDRLRKVVRKPLTNADLIRVVEQAVEMGFSSVKLYYIIGFPGETRDDLLETVEVLRQLSAIASRAKRSFIIRPSFNCLVPKPNTPFQYAPMLDEETYQERIRWLKRQLRPLPSIHASFMNPLYAYYQAVLSLGDASVARIVDAVENKDGAWRSVIRDVMDDYRDLFFRSEKRFVLERQYVSIGYREDFIKKEYLKAVQSAEMGLPAGDVVNSTKP